MIIFLPHCILQTAPFEEGLPCRIFCCFFIHPTAAPRGAQACAPGPVMLGSVLWICDSQKVSESRGNDSIRHLAFRFWVTHCRSQEVEVK